MRECSYQSQSLETNIPNSTMRECNVNKSQEEDEDDRVSKWEVILVKYGHCFQKEDRRHVGK